MIKIFLFPVVVLTMCWTLTFAQQNNNPKIYKIQPTSTSLGGTSRISVIDALTQNLKDSFPIPLSGQEIEISKDGKKGFINATLGSNGSNVPGLVAVDLGQGNFKGAFNGQRVYRAKLSPNNVLWVLLGDENKIVLLNPDTLTPILVKDNIERPTDIVFSPDGQKAYISQSTITFSNVFVSIGVFDTKTLTSLGAFNQLPPTASVFQRPKELQISPDGNTLYIVTKKTITIIDANSLRMKGTFDFPNLGAFSLVRLLVSPDGKTLYIAEFGDNIYAYDIENKTFKNIFNAKLFTGIEDLQITEDNRLLYLSDGFGNSIIDAKTNAEIFSFNDSFGTGIALAGDFSIGQPPLLQTMMPVASQQVITNQPLTITWQTVVAPQSYSLASHSIELSTDGGTTFNTIPGAEQLKADVQSFTWQVPNIEVAKAQIRVSTVDLGARRAASTTGNFSISKGGGSTGDTQAPTVNFLSPKGGERFNSGDSLQISWTSSDNVGVTSQDLSLSSDGGATFPITLASGLSGATQNFTYQIPMSLQSDQTKLRLVVRDAAGNSSQAVTANNFSILLGADTINPTVTISQPSQAQSIIAGQPIQVKWQSFDNRAVVSQALLLSFDNGKTFTQIMGFGATENSFVLSGLDKLNLTTPQAMVKITAMDGTGNKGEVNSLFTISPAITTASYQTKVLTISGIGFMSNVNNTIKLFVNDKEVTLPPNSVNNSTFMIKGNKKKLNIIKGSNTVKVIVDGVMSNSVSFSF